MARHLSLEEARRIAIRAQLLDADRPTDLLTVVQQLTFLQVDPTSVVAPNADLVAWSRIGNSYAPAHLQQALEADRTLFEQQSQPTPTDPVIAMVRPMADLGLFLGDMKAWPSADYPRTRQWMKDNDRFRRDILKLLRTKGPLMSRDIPDTAAVSWESSGWRNDRNVTQMLEFLSRGGQVAIAGRKGRHRLWAVAEQVYPPTEIVGSQEAKRIRDERWLRSLGVARPQAVGDAGAPATIEGTVGEWRVDPDASATGFEGRTALLSPFDRLIHNRVRAVELFGFEYLLEMYKPKEQRRWGYFALPVLHGDRLVGKVDIAADRKASRLLVHSLHPDVRFTKAITTAVNKEIDALADWLGMAAVSRP